jgi:hypothetical protein
MTSTSAHTRSQKFTQEQKTAVKAELDALLRSVHFSGTRRCYEFLEFVVNGALSGDYESLTERTLGAELFGRPIDYETGSDAIVRVRANDVRRRLAEYYSEQHAGSQVIISLPSGSYIPEFHWSGPEAPAAPGVASDPLLSLGRSALLNPPGATQPDVAIARRKLTKPVLVTSAFLLALFAGLMLLLHRSASPDRALNEFWQPLIHDRSSVIICFGNTTSYWPSTAVKQAIDAGDLAFTVPPGGITEMKDDNVTEGNLRAAVSIANLLYGFGVSDELRWPQEVQSADLSRSNVIFVGAFNNPWSMTLNESLRYSFKQVHTESQSVWMIQDRKSPNQNWSITKAYPEQSEVDYALITRIIDHEGKRVEISVGGLSQFGTQAAGEFLTDEEAMSALARSAPGGWEHRNLQIVLGMRVDGRKIVNPRILAANFW